MIYDVQAIQSPYAQVEQSADIEVFHIRGDYRTVRRSRFKTKLLSNGRSTWQGGEWIVVGYSPQEALGVIERWLNRKDLPKTEREFRPTHCESLTS